MLNIKNISKKDPDPVGSGLFGVNRIRILKTGSADPDPHYCFQHSLSVSFFNLNLRTFISYSDVLPDIFAGFFAVFIAVRRFTLKIKYIFLLVPAIIIVSLEVKIHTSSVISHNCSYILVHVRFVCRKCIIVILLMYFKCYLKKQGV